MVYVLSQNHQSVVETALRTLNNRNNPFEGSLKSGKELLFGQNVTTSTGKVSLSLNTDGLFLHRLDDGAILWQARTPRAVAKCVMQPDGNLVMLDIDGKAIWNSGTWKGTGAEFTFEDGGDSYVHKDEIYYLATWKWGRKLEGF